MAGTHACKESVERDQPTAIRPAFSAAGKQTAWLGSMAAHSLAIRDLPALTGEQTDLKKKKLTDSP